MARRRSRKAAKISPAEKEFLIEIPGAGINGYVDTAQILSVINRKAYRQGFQYVIQNIELISDATGTLYVYRLPHTWVCANAWVKAFKNWKDQQRDAMRESGSESMEAKYNDFKVFLTMLHAEAGIAANLWPVGYLTEAQAVAVDPSAVYDWEAAEFIVPNDGVPGVTGEYTGHMTGPDSAIVDSKSLVVAYAQSRSRPTATDPNTVNPPTDGGLYQDMEDVGDELPEVMENVRFGNNQPPYFVGDQSVFEFYPGGEEDHGSLAIEAILSSASSSYMGRTQAGSFLADCGLIWLWSQGFDGGTSTHLKITVAPGEYHGVMARPMQDVN